MVLSLSEIQPVVDAALAEDRVWDDITTRALIADDLEGRAAMVVKGEGVLAGIGVATLVFHTVDSSLEVKELISDGTRIVPGDIAATIGGKIASILRAERVALNFVQRLSGIASETARYVEAVSGLKVRIMDTRKTTPGLRLLEKYAVRVGGGYNHRQNLSDGILIKDNHLAALRSHGAGLREVIERTRRNAPHTFKIEVEVETTEQAKKALDAGAEVLLLDNMTLEDMRQAVELARGRALTEASGGITLATVRSIAETGVDFISIGALTHSPKALDISLELGIG